MFYYSISAQPALLRYTTIMPKPPIILIHGFRGTHHGLVKIAEPLRKTYDVYVPDIPGFGEGDELPSYSLDAYVSWLRDYIRNLNLPVAPILLGHSFGSIISAAYAARYGDTITKLILVNPIGAPALEGPRGILSKLAIFYYWTGSKLPASVAKKWLSAQFVTDIISSTMTKTTDRQLKQWIKNEHRKRFSTFHSANSVHEGFVTSVSHSVRDVAKNITTPTLLIAGELDDITQVAEQQHLQTLFPNATLHIISGTGHLTHYETPAEVAALTQAFISSS